MPDNCIRLYRIGDSTQNPTLTIDEAIDLDNSDWRDLLCERLNAVETPPDAIEARVVIDGVDYCGHNRCPVCSQWFHPHSFIVCCSACAETHDQCHGCNEWFERNDLQYDEYGYPLCLDCSEDRFICERCGHWRDRDSEYYDDCVCIHCARASTIHEYHYTPPLLFHPDAQRHSLFLGVELETDGFSSSDRTVAGKALQELNEDEALFWMTDDGSLSCGIEIISQPCTLEYHLTKFPWAEVCKMVENLGGKSHNTDTCGLHIHLSRSFFGQTREQEDATTKRLCYLIEQFWTTWVKFARRESNDNAARYARDFKGMRTATFRGMKEDWYTNGERYRAVNFCRDNTIELRIFKGTLLVPTLFATLELADFLARYSVSQPDDVVYNISWSKLVRAMTRKRYPHLVPYLAARKIMPSRYFRASKPITSRPPRRRGRPLSLGIDYDVQRASMQPDQGECVTRWTAASSSAEGGT